MCSVKLRTCQERQGRFFFTNCMVICFRGSLFQRVLCFRGFFVSEGSFFRWFFSQRVVCFRRVPSEGVPDVTFQYFFLTGAPKCVLVTPFLIFERCRIRAQRRPAVLPRRGLPTQPLVSLARHHSLQHALLSPSYLFLATDLSTVL